MRRMGRAEAWRRMQRLVGELALLAVDVDLAMERGQTLEPEMERTHLILAEFQEALRHAEASGGALQLQEALGGVNESASTAMS